MLAILKHTSHSCQEGHFAAVEHTSRGWLYRGRMKKARRSTQDNFRENLRKLIWVFVSGWGWLTVFDMLDLVRIPFRWFTNG